MTATAWRVLPVYDPHAEIVAAGWVVVLDALSVGTEHYDCASQVVTFDPDAYAEDPLHALAHAAYHIRSGDVYGGRFTAEQEACANSAAWLWLDREPELS